MPILRPTHYRAMLPREAQKAYRQVTAALLRMEGRAVISPPVRAALVPKIVQAVHYDHPELFYVDFWHYRQVYSPLTGRCGMITFDLLMNPQHINAFRRTMDENIAHILAQCGNASPDMLYRRVASIIARSVTYKRGDNENALLYHSIFGAMTNHTSVCEGISKLFLLYCQHLKLPCILVSGNLKEEAHAWNVVETSKGLRHVDVTAELGHMSAFGFNSLTLMKGETQMRYLGYTWDPIALTPPA